MARDMEAPASAADTSATKTVIENTATAGTNAASTGSNTKMCYLLEKLPAELRTIIYELAFTTDLEQASTGEIRFIKLHDLHSPTPPSKSLLLSCRQIHHEARSLYQLAYQNYWTNTPFSLDGHAICQGQGEEGSDDRVLAIQAYLEQKLPVQDISKVTKLTIVDRHGRPYTLVDKDGVWRGPYRFCEHGYRREMLWLLYKREPVVTPGFGLVKLLRSFDLLKNYDTMLFMKENADARLTFLEQIAWIVDLGDAFPLPLFSADC